MQSEGLVGMPWFQLKRQVTGRKQLNTPNPRKAIFLSLLIYTYNNKDRADQMSEAAMVTARVTGEGGYIRDTEADL